VAEDLMEDVTLSRKIIMPTHSGKEEDYHQHRKLENCNCKVKKEIIPPPNVVEYKKNKAQKKTRSTFFGAVAGGLDRHRRSHRGDPSQDSERLGQKIQQVIFFIFFTFLFFFLFFSFFPFMGSRTGSMGLEMGTLVSRFRQFYYTAVGKCAGSRKIGSRNKFGSRKIGSRNKFGSCKIGSRNKFGSRKIGSRNKFGSRKIALQK
jgi:hypothetical protein